MRRKHQQGLAHAECCAASEKQVENEGLDGITWTDGAVRRTDALAHVPELRLKQNCNTHRNASGARARGGNAGSRTTRRNTGTGMEPNGASHRQPQLIAILLTLGMQAKAK
ncbi:hypothetical protein Q1695_000564 [Nippostrongylus brasiliensis]|nr:hypothetical protein Q1695_000564 [Nippostrongylus brasiliensis]